MRDSEMVELLETANDIRKELGGDGVNAGVTVKQGTPEQSVAIRQGFQLRTN